MVKRKNNISFDFLDIIDFVKRIEGVSTNRAVAKALKINENDLSNRKKRGSIPYKHIIEWAIERGVSLDIVLTNRDISSANNRVHFPTIQRAHRPLDLTPPNPEVAQDVGMAWSVLESGTSTAEALRLNVHEFYEKVFGKEKPKKKENAGGEK